MKYRHSATWAVSLALLCAPAGLLPAVAADAASAPPVPLPRLEVQPYMGTWYQVAWYPNWFQRKCASDTQATYRLLPEGRVEVLNRCRTAEGATDGVLGVAKPVGKLEGGALMPAQLEVSFLPTWLRWLPIGWGSYWVVHLADDGRYAIVSEGSREYLWVLARSPLWSAEDQAEVRAVLQKQGFDLTKLQAHPQKAALPGAS